MAEEVELKFELESEHVAMLGKLQLLASAPAHSQPQLTVYYDTPKGLVRKQGFTLRVRKAGARFVQTVKPAATGAGLFARDEWEWDVGSIEPEPRLLAGTPLEGLADSRRVGAFVPLFRSEVQRTSRRLGHGASVIAVDLDQGTITADGDSDAFTELELELVSGSRRDLVEAALIIAERVPVRLGVLSKAERGFALADGSLGKVAKAGPVAVAPQMSVADGFTVIVNACLKHFRRNEPIVVRERKVEALHQVRVAMRRLRSAFSLFKPAVADWDFEALRQELRWFTNLLGEARNLDVFLQRDDLGAPPAELLARRERAYDVIADALGSKRFRMLMVSLVGWLATGAWRSTSKAQRPLPPFAGRRLDRLWRNIAGSGRLEAMDDGSRHELRIEVKKLRYGVEFFRSLYPDQATVHKAFAQAIEALQERLGELNDLVTAQALGPELETVGAGPEPQAEPASVERLVAEAEHALDQLRRIGPYWSTAI